MRIVLDLVLVQPERLGDPLGQIDDRLGVLAGVLVALLERLRERGDDLDVRADRRRDLSGLALRSVGDLNAAATLEPAPSSAMAACARSESALCLGRRTFVQPDFEDSRFSALNERGNPCRLFKRWHNGLTSSLNS